MKFIKKIIAKFILWVWGWKIVLEGPASNLDRCVLVVAPHTANDEYILGNLAYWVLDKKLKVIIKDAHTKAWYGFIVKNKININGTTIEYDSENADSVIINGKKYPKKVADSILEKDIKNINSLKDLENLKDLNISIKDGDSKIEINTKK